MVTDSKAAIISFNERQHPVDYCVLGVTKHCTGHNDTGQFVN